MKIKKLPNLENKEVKIKDDIKKPTFNSAIFQPYFRLNVSASSGSGKTNAIINLFEKMYPKLDKSFVISASIFNDPKQQNTFMERDNVMVFTEPSVSLLEDIIDEVKRINEEHKKYLKVKKVFDKWRKADFDESKLKGDELIMLYNCDFDPNKMEYNKETKPNMLLFMDDLQGLDILKHKVFENLTIKSRHHSLNIIITTQTFRGISNVWRRNSSAHMIFKTNDLNQIKTIYDEISGLFKDYDEFLDLYNYATADKFNFLYIDTMDTENGIRKNFDEVIIRDEI